MSNSVTVNAHEYHSLSKDRLTCTLVEEAMEAFSSTGHRVKAATTKDDYGVADASEKHRWGDVVIVQTPVNRMDVSWSFKKVTETLSPQAWRAPFASVASAPGAPIPAMCFRWHGYRQALHALADVQCAGKRIR